MRLHFNASPYSELTLEKWNRKSIAYVPLLFWTTSLVSSSLYLASRCIQLFSGSYISPKIFVCRFHAWSSTAVVIGIDVWNKCQLAPKPKFSSLNRKFGSKSKIRINCSVHILNFLDIIKCFFVVCYLFIYVPIFSATKSNNTCTMYDVQCI